MLRATTCCIDLFGWVHIFTTPTVEMSDRRHGKTGVCRACFKDREQAQETKCLFLDATAGSTADKRQVNICSTVMQFAASCIPKTARLCSMAAWLTDGLFTPLVSLAREIFAEQCCNEEVLCLNSPSYFREVRPLFVSFRLVGLRHRTTSILLSVARTHPQEELAAPRVSANDSQ